MTAVHDTTTTATVQIAPVAGHIGAEISGVDLRETLTDQQVEDITAALHKYKVLFFRDQHIGHAEQIAFSRRFGAVTPHIPTTTTRRPSTWRSSPSIAGCTKSVSACGNSATRTSGTPMCPR